MIKNNKSEGLSITVMITAVIGLIILLVVAALIVRNTALFSKTVDASCMERNGVCLYSSGKESCSEIDGKPLRMIVSGCPSSKSDTKKDSGPCCLPLNE